MLVLNSSTSWFLWKENQINKQNIAFLENKIDRLDIGALEKIKLKESVEIDCSSNTSGDWLSSTLCD